MEPTCSVCRSSGAVSALMQKNGHPLYRCSDCDHIFLDPLPTDEELARLYSFASGYQKQQSVLFEEQQEFPEKFRLSVEQLARHLPSGRVLDVGSSSGIFLWLARQAGYDVQGVELNEDTAAIARENDLPVFVGRLEDADFPPHGFDAVHLGDLIEHVTDPAALLADVRRLLKEGGVLVVVTPNHDAFFPRTTLRLMAAGIPWSHPTPPFHLNQFSVKSLTRLLEAAGFEVIEERFVPCSLRYELRGTGVFRPLREAIEKRRWAGAVAHSFRAAWATLAYGSIWLADRAAFFKTHDFTMRLVARAR